MLGGNREWWAAPPTAARTLFTTVVKYIHYPDQFAFYYGSLKLLISYLFAKQKVVSHSIERPFIQDKLHEMTLKIERLNYKSFSKHLKRKHTRIVIS